MKDSKLNIVRIRTNSEKIACAEIMTYSEPWSTIGMSVDHIMDTLNYPLQDVYAAYMGEEIVGTMVIHTKGAFPAYLKCIAVKPDLSGRKLIGQMMEFIEKVIFSTYKNLFLCVSSFDLAAQNFYNNLGYEKIGELKNYLVEGHNEILMRKTIAPILKKP